LKHFYNIYNASAGSGKTFNLVKEYLKILLTDNQIDSYKNILSITFTNKAVNEMKSRIIGSLNQLTKIDKEEKNNPLLDSIKKETNLTNEEIQLKSISILKSILINYASFNVSTIDKFTQKIIRNFAYEIKLPVNYEVEIKANDLLEESTAKLISRAGVDTKLTKALINFSFEKSANDKSWDIEYDLNNISKLLLNENHFEHISSIESKDLEDFEMLKKRIDNHKIKIESEIVNEATNCLNLIHSKGLDESDFLSQAVPKHLKKIKSKDFNGLYSSQLESNIKNGYLYKKTLIDDKKSIIDSMSEELYTIFTSLKKKIFKFKFYENIQSNNRPLSILKHINSELEIIKKERNIILISEFNKIVNNQIKNQPALFIYEKIGVKYKHFFIDEFQDTSKLQWNNLIPLIENSLSSENSSLSISGDIKQAIYRWRGGEPEQLLKLCNNDTDFFIKSSVVDLETNYRSRDEIIKFNNSLFTHISKFVFTSDIHKNIYNNCQQESNNNLGGYVGVNILNNMDSTVEKENTYNLKLHEIIQDSLKNNYELRDICILVRTNDQGIKISDFLNKKDIDIISSETLLISKSEEVEFIIAILKFCSQPKLTNSKLDIINYLHRKNNLKTYKHTFIKRLITKNKKDFFKELHQLNLYFDYNILTKSSLYEAVEYIIYAFKLSNKSNNYIQFFLDFAFDYSNKNFANILDFIGHYESKKDTLSIVAPEESDAVKVMTIHKSKGLEFPIVIYAYADIDIYKEKDVKEWYPVIGDEFNGFNNLLLSFNKNFEFFGDVGNSIYKTHLMNLELDNINLLYVALTRAQDELHIICSNSINNKGEENLKKYSGMFINYLRKNNLWEEDKETFEFGQKIKNDTSNKTSNSSLIDDFIINPKEIHKINIDARSAKTWGTNQEKARGDGNLLHEIMSNIKSSSDLDKTIQEFCDNGTLDLKFKQKYINLITSILEHNELKPYYSKDLKSFNERDIIVKNNEPIRADRIVFTTNKEICIIDYKTGKLKKADYDQLNSYEKVLSSMGYKVKDKIIINTENKLEVIKF
jgi:ATP-dependent exoDNAse (exonuclease V) beta subunit